MAGAAREVLGVGLAASLPCDAPLPLPPLHPATSPGFLLTVDLVDDVVVSADVGVGLMHRSAEKLFEVRDYRQAMALADRHDWLSSACSEATVALAAESALGIVPPERATWARTLLVEAQRMGAALSFVAPVAGEVSAAAHALIERLTVTQQRLTGARIHPAYLRIGGVACAVPEEVLVDYAASAAAAAGICGSLSDAVAAFAEPHADAAQLTRDQAIKLGTGGIVARASGLDIDLRRDQPALSYAELADVVDVSVGTAGDVPARFALLVDEVRHSARLVAACVDRLRELGPGPFDVPLPKVVRLPEGTTYAWLESGLGIAGALLVSTGGKTPWRMKVRSASFATMQAMTVALAGTRRSSLSAAVASFPTIMGDVDR